MRVHDVENAINTFPRSREKYQNASKCAKHNDEVLQPLIVTGNCP